MRPEWWTGLAGGGLIGLGAAFLLYTNGRIAGVSGILGGALRPRANDLGWRVAFIGGLLLGGLLSLVWPARFDVSALPSTAWLIAAGLLVGFGTRLGNGCTSGHGVCGIGRASPRSLVATATFMLTAGITVYLGHAL